MEYPLTFFRMAIGLAFLLAFLGKAQAPKAFVRAVADFDLLPRRANVPAAFLFLAGEATVVVLMATTGASLRLGFALSLLMLAAFSAAIASALRRELGVSCNCFGASEAKLSRSHLLRNAGFMACALGGLFLSGAGASPLGFWEVSLVALVTVAFVAAWSQLDQVVELLH